MAIRSVRRVRLMGMHMVLVLALEQEQEQQGKQERSPRAGISCGIARSCRPCFPSSRSGRVSFLCVLITSVYRSLLTIGRFRYSGPPARTDPPLALTRPRTSFGTHHPPRAGARCPFSAPEAAGSNLGRWTRARRADDQERERERGRRGGGRGRRRQRSIGRKCAVRKRSAPRARRTRGSCLLGARRRTDHRGTRIRLDRHDIRACHGRCGRAGPVCASRRGGGQEEEQLVGTRVVVEPARGGVSEQENLVVRHIRLNEVVYSH